MGLLVNADELITESLETMITHPQSVIVAGLSAMSLALVTAWVIYKAYLIMAGFVQEPFYDLIKEFIKKSLILAVATSAGLYGTFFGNPINDLNEGLAGALTETSSSDSKPNIYGSIEDHMEAISFLIDAQWSDIDHESINPANLNDSAEKLENEGSWLTSIWNGIKKTTKVITSPLAPVFDFFISVKETVKLLIVLLGVGWITVAAFLVITLNKLFLTLCLGFAPLFIFFAAFEPTKGWFNSWLNNTLGYALSYPVVVFGVKTLLDIYAQIYSSSDLNFAMAIGCLVLGIVFAVLISRLGDIASGWFGSGNIADGTLGAMALATPKAIKGMAKTAKAGKATAKGGWAATKFMAKDAKQTGKDFAGMGKGIGRGVRSGYNKLRGKTETPEISLNSSNKG